MQISYDNVNAPAWYVLRSKPHKENQLYNQLCINTIETYYPTISVNPVNPRSVKIRPYFPGYIFVHVNLHEIGPNILQWLPGGLGLVEFGGYIPFVPDYFIHNIQQYINEIQNKNAPNFNDLKKGDSVKILDGPFAGYKAIFEAHLNAKGRVCILLDMLGRSVSTEVHISSLQKQHLW